MRNVQYLEIWGGADEGPDDSVCKLGVRGRGGEIS